MEYGKYRGMSDEKIELVKFKVITIGTLVVTVVLVVVFVVVKAITL